METNDQTEESKISEANAAQYNSFTASWMLRIENLCNTIILVSGGIMSVSIASFVNLSNKKSLSPTIFANIEPAWWYLSISLLSAIMLKLLIVFTGLCTKNKMNKDIRSNEKLSGKLYDVHCSVYSLGIFFCLVSFCSCAGGIFFVSHAALGFMEAMSPSN